MKKFVKDPKDYGAEMVEGLALANPDTLKYVPEYNPIMRADAPLRGRVPHLAGHGRRLRQATIFRFSSSEPSGRGVTGSFDDAPDVSVGRAAFPRSPVQAVDSAHLPRSAFIGPAAVGRTSKSNMAVGTYSEQQALGMSTMPLMRPSMGEEPSSR